MILAWGKCGAVIHRTDIPDQPFIELPTPVDGTTKLASTQGAKKEAKIEGGENEAVRYAKNTNKLDLSLRGAKGRRRPLKDSDGTIEGEYEVFIQPENKTATGVYLPKVNLNAQTSFDTEDGLVWPYSADTVTPDDGGDQVREGEVEFLRDKDKKVVGVRFTEWGKGDGEDKPPVVFGKDPAVEAQAAPANQEAPGAGA